MQKPSSQFTVPQEAVPYMTPISPKDFAKRDFSDEYSFLHHITSGDDYTSRLIRDDCFRTLNRYVDILPYEHTIVKLDEKKLNPDNYINGNFLNNPLVDSNKKSFILTQGPLENTKDDFWRMVELEGVVNVLSIVETASLGSRCTKYWPDKKTKTENYEIEALSHSKNTLFHKKDLKLSNLKTNTEQRVTHYHLYNWVDFSTLTGNDINGLISLIEQLYNEEAKALHPIVVHCSAGVGRSGTFAAVFFAYEYWKYCTANKVEFKISVFDLVLKMRGMRYGLVQTAQQYKFIYSLIAKFK